MDLPRSAGLCWIVVLGNRPFARPGTKTWSNSRPFATWIVMTLTESSSEGWTGDHSCLSRFSTASTYSRNARSVSSPWTGENACTSSRNAARLRRAPAAEAMSRWASSSVRMPGPPDDLAEELAHRAARLDAECRQFLAALLEARPALFGDPLDLVQMLQAPR